MKIIYATASPVSNFLTPFPFLDLYMAYQECNNYCHALVYRP